jgi:hypothetical protein
MPTDEWDAYDDERPDDPDAWRDTCDDPAREDV